MGLNYYNYDFQSGTNSGLLIGMLLAALSYVFISIGTLGLGVDFDLVRLVLLPAWLLAMILVLRANVLKLRVIPVLLFLLCAIYLLIQLYRSEKIELALAKVDGVLIGGIILYCTWRTGLLLYGERFIDMFIQVGLLFLFLTFMYKLNAGFWDRGVRFFINGPNVYGWILALLSILSIYRFSLTKNKRYIVFILLFVVAIFWTQSKGPFVALIGGGFAYMLVSGGVKHLLVALVSFLVIVLTLWLNDLIPARYLVFFNLMDSNFLQDNYGSIGIRFSMLIDGINIFLNNMAFGIGMANWDLYSSTSESNGPISHPHNIVVELLAEHGAAGFLLFGFTLLAIFVKTTKLGKAVVAIFLIGLMFSGDMTYWRLLYALPLALMPIKNVKWNTLSIYRYQNKET
ncbi:O-antigen ligase family protein [Bacterioplanoides sp.]|uniref:O-antigen ligase family protein n=1 Tax=Bacterioplanoides sp. TaxID=2066072 RepID=UPI003B00E506